MKRHWFFLLTIALRAQTPEQRAVDYLAREVPRWSRENQCFSCHNNGDGARALYTAMQNHYRVPPAALADTTRWLRDPEHWDENRGNPAFSDKKLARIQFAAALAEAGVPERPILVRAAASLLPYQEPDGSWQVDAGAAVGSPATWGAALATFSARRVLEQADSTRFAGAIEKANGWFNRLKPANILDAAAKLLALPSAKGQTLDTILNARSSDGGWGPRAHAPSEPFDTAVVLLALREADGPRAAIDAGRKYLIATQQESGGWPETTRPPGGHSYAQHISTCGWATLALLLTR